MDPNQKPEKRWSERVAIGTVAALSVVGWLSISLAVSFVFPGNGATNQMADEELDLEQLGNFATAAGGNDCEDRLGAEAASDGLVRDPACEDPLDASATE